ncbi:MAG: tRNA (adenosine(37)-N6)-threonylcarbamoyltransferase complex ATPase subunit type 1 TsaE [Pseudomonadota bacterium]|nr:tRNA (adenosine(37)-N6)-threonylcarbamoyltransferase complex ATPase subunit type 1 TsaE [Pseudomonadota bacterium]
MTATFTRTIDTTNEGDTRAIAGTIAGISAGGDIIGLAGELGSGKTAFARGFIHALGNTGEIPSPTFTLVQIYNFADRVFHFDLYRLEKPEDAFELDLDDAFHSGISLIEWPEKLGPYLPSRRLMITMEFGQQEGARRLHMEAPSRWAARIQGLEFNV